MPVTVSDVLVAVSRRFNVTPDLLRGPRTARPYSGPRQIAYLVVAEMCPHLSLPKIAQHFGNRDHTTIMWGLRVARKRVAADKDLELVVNEIERELRAAVIPSTQVIHGANPESMLRGEA